jgi:hypothetical protein
MEGSDWNTHQQKWRTSQRRQPPKKKKRKKKKRGTPTNRNGVQANAGNHQKASQ